MAERILHMGSFDRCAAMCLIDQLEEMDATSNEDILLSITSDGGCCFSLFAILDAIDRAKSKVSTLVVGKAYSAGAVLLAAGATGKRFAMPNSRVMFHEPRGYAMVTGKDPVEMEFCNEVMLDTVVDRLKMSPDDFAEMVKRDTFLTPEDAKEIGLIDEVLSAV